MAAIALGRYECKRAVNDVEADGEPGSRRLWHYEHALALVLASIGLYGVTSFNVGRRVNEIGIRMALGANRGQILTMILREAFALIAVGLVMGVPMALAAGWLLSSQLYGVSQRNPIILSIAIATLAGCAFLATILPAYRASSVSPLKASRVD
jgi:ABC-type antimicrobial peptide transport system permease subunit